MNVKYQFSESRLPEDFAKENMDKMKHLIDSSYSFTTLAMPGMGVSYLLRFLATRDFANFIHVDLYSLSNLTKHEFFRLLLHELGGKSRDKTDLEMLTECKKTLSDTAKKHPKIVLIFNRFDQLKKEFDETFFANLRALRDCAPGKIVLLFTAIKPLYETSPKAIGGANLNIFSKHLYLKPYSKYDLQQLLKITLTHKIPAIQLSKLIELSGGHSQLLHILINSEKKPNPLLDHFVKLQMKELLDYLNYPQKKQVKKIALRKTAGEIDDYLLGVGMVKKVKSGHTLFSSLLTEYIKSNLQLRLPVKEARLFRVLRNNFGKTVSYEEIFEYVWEEDLENATNWALDSLIYRLRKNPGFISFGYAIENHKKVGYILLQN